VVSSPASLAGAISVPGDKSISHRALILNSIAKGSALVSGLSSGADVLSTMACMKAMGAKIEESDQPGSVTINGSDSGLQEPLDVLDAGNSGTSMRLLCGLMASQEFTSVLTGDGSLRSRPMGRVVEPLKEMGATIIGRKQDTLAPLTLRGGALRGIEYTMPVASAQVKSSIMLAGLSAQGDTILHQPALSRDHTERMLFAMGVPVEIDGLTLTLRPGPLHCVDLIVPGDISSAAYWLVAGLCHPNARVLVTGVGLNPSRTGILEALKAMGAGDALSLKNERDVGGEPVADLMAQSCQLKGTEIGGDIIPRIIDELPILAVAACFAEGTTVIRDASELKFKESDRIDTTVTQLSRLGAKIEAREDGMVIHDLGRLTGATCESFGDHRLAMSLAIAGLLAKGVTSIQGADAASVSYPSFWEHLDQLSGGQQGQA
jgi:3-phosphoshikimate 1-carboxyvinyltransferase